MLLGHGNLCHVVTRGLTRDQAVLQVDSAYTHFLQKCEVTKNIALKNLWDWRIKIAKLKLNQQIIQGTKFIFKISLGF